MPIVILAVIATVRLQQWVDCVVILQEKFTIYHLPVSTFATGDPSDGRDKRRGWERESSIE